MVNAFLLLSPIGMMAVGLGAILFWKLKKHVAWKFFIWGAFLWILAIIPKLVLDLTVTTSIYGGLYAYGTAALVIGAGLYLGLRTGLFESGFTYIAGRKLKSLKKIKLDEAIAFGLGFGGFEAFILGVGGFLSLSAFILNPSLVSLLPPAQQASLDSPTIIVGAAILERVFTVFVHVFSSLLVFYSIARKKGIYLVYSILFKAVVDGIIPALSVYIDSSTVTGTYLIELPFLALAFISWLGTMWLMRLYPSEHHESHHKEPEASKEAPKKAGASRKK